MQSQISASKKSLAMYEAKLTHMSLSTKLNLFYRSLRIAPSHLDLCSGTKILAKFRRQKGPLSTVHTKVIQCDQLEPIAKTAWGNLSPSRKIPDCMYFARKNSQHNGK